MRIIAGRWRGRPLDAPRGRTTRPTSDRVREAWMSALQFELPDSRVLDLFAGSGALGLEALSRGAAHVTFVENGAPALRALAANIERLGAGAATTVIRRDAIDFAAALEPAAFDIAFADPPYGDGLAARVAEIFLERPFARMLWVEHRVGETLPASADTRTRRYGDTALTSLTSPDHD
jgi:16S rRNA (guanine966-N2)-methyltransferase